MNWLKENWFKLSLVIAVLVLGLSYIFYLKDKENNRKFEAQSIALQQAESKQKEYSADRKADCLVIYKTESDKWNNVVEWDYSDLEDTCTITYKESNPKSSFQCDEDFPTDAGFNSLWANYLCKDGRFEKEF